LSICFKDNIYKILNVTSFRSRKRRIVFS